MQINKYTSWKLDYVRAFAALFVMIGHARGAFFLSYGDLSPDYQGLITKLFFLVTRIGHQCVIIFFVMSGYLVGGLSLQKYLSGTLSTTKYIVNRLTRIYIVVLPTLLVGGILNYATGLSENLEIKILFGNIFHLQTVCVPTFGSNGPLWSLAYEFWYYILFIIIIRIMQGIKNRWVSTGLLIMMMTGFILVMPNIAAYALVWACGMTIPFIVTYISRPMRLIRRLLKLFFIPAVIVCNIFNNYFTDLALAVYTTVLLSLIVSNGSPIMRYKVLLKISSFSFSLYAIHYPILLFVIKLFRDNFGFVRKNTITTLEISEFFILNAILISCSYVFYLCFEKRTPYMRGLIIKKGRI